MAQAYGTVCNWKINAAGSYAAPGIVTGGEDGVETAWRRRFGAGGIEVATVEDLMIRPTLDVDCTGSTKALITAALRASYPMGTLTETIHLQYGTELEGWTIGAPMTSPSVTNTCAINTMRLAWQEGDVLKASFGFMALKAVRDTDGITQAALADIVPYGDGTIVATVGGSDLTCVGFELNVNNNYKTRAPAVSRGSGEKKFRSALERGACDVEAVFDVLVSPTVDLAADAPTHTTDGSIVANNGATTITIALNDMGHRRPAFQLRERDDGAVVWRLTMDCYSSALSIS